MAKRLLAGGGQSQNGQGLRGVIVIVPNIEGQGSQFGTRISIEQRLGPDQAKDSENDARCQILVSYPQSCQTHPIASQIRNGRFRQPVRIEPSINTRNLARLGLLPAPALA